MKKTSILTAALMLLVSIPALSQNNVSRKISFEVGGGSAGQLSKVNGEQGSAYYSTSGSSANLRINYHLDNNWGLYLEASYQEASFSEADYFGALNKADGGKYRYGLYNSWYSTLYQGQNNFMLGGFYRLPLKRFTLMPRVSIGLAIPVTMDFEYQRINKNGEEGPEYFSIHSPIVVADDYLIDSNEAAVSEKLLQFGASLQVNYEAFKHFYVFVEPGLTYSPFKISMVTEHYSSKKYSEPSNWAEAVGQPSYGQKWVKDPDSKSSTLEKRNFASFYYFNFGLGIRF